MTRVNRSNSTYFSKAGYGKQGYCMLCSLEPRLQDGVDDRLRRGFGPTSVAKWLGIQTNDVPVTRQTVASHRNHIASPKDRLVTAVTKRQMQGTLPQVTTEAQFTDAVLSLAQHNMMADPNAVTIDHGLRAAQIKATEKANKSASINVLIGFINGGISIPNAPTVIEGEASYAD